MTGSMTTTAFAAPQNGTNQRESTGRIRSACTNLGGVSQREGACADRVRSLVATPYPVIEGPLPARAIPRTVAIVPRARARLAPMTRLELGDLSICARRGASRRSVRAIAGAGRASRLMAIHRRPNCASTFRCSRFRNCSWRIGNDTSKALGRVPPASFRGEARICRIWFSSPAGGSWKERDA